MRTIDDVLRDWAVILSGRTHYEGQEPRDDELMIAEIDRLRGQIVTLRVAVERAASQFGLYARHHMNKTPPATGKARVNVELAVEMRAALAATAPEGER